MMQLLWKRPLLFFLALTTCIISSVSTIGCVSGGFKLTRQYARWVNTKHIILRIVLYILTLPVFVITLVIDAVLFNTMDFWNGRVSQGTYNFKGKDKSFVVKHEILPDSNRKRSTINIYDLKKSFLHEIVLLETATKEIEVYVDGHLRSRVNDIDSLPVATIYDEKGIVISEGIVPMTIKEKFKLALSKY